MTEKVLGVQSYKKLEESFQNIIYLEMEITKN